MYYIIYQTTNLINGKIYVGKHRTENLDDGYIGSGVLLWRAIDKYGIENFKREILFFCESQEELDSKEREIVNENFLKRPDVYNLKLGGAGGWDFNNVPENHNNKHNHRRIGFVALMDRGINPWIEWWKNASDEEIKDYCEKISEGVKRYNAEFGCWWTGKHHSEETKKKMSDFHAMFHPQAGSKNSQYGKHWWKDPNDKTKCSLFKDGDQPEGWVRGKWQLITDEEREKIRERNIKNNTGKILITNGIINKKINKNDPIPEGFKKGYLVKNKIYYQNELQEKRSLSEEEMAILRSEASKRGHETRRKKLFEKNYPIIKEQYEYWMTHTWKEFVEKYNYKYTAANFVQTCKAYLGIEWKPKKNFSQAKTS